MRVLKLLFLCFTVSICLGNKGLHKQRRIIMAYSKTDVMNVCLKVAPQYQFEPLQLYALARQESAKTKEGWFDASIPRLEQGFFQNYIKGNHQLPAGLPTTALSLLATSYGCYQIMGYELWRLKWMDEWFNKLDNPNWKDTLNNPYSQIALLQSLDGFCMDLESQCKYACKLLTEKRNTANKMDSFKGATDKEEICFLLYNGGGDPDYGKKILKWKAMGFQ